MRAIADVSTAVTEGDLTRQITVEAKGEVAELKDNINQMIANLRETTERNAEQDWLNTNLARFCGMMQGQRDLQTVSRADHVRADAARRRAARRVLPRRGRRGRETRRAAADRELRLQDAQEGVEPLQARRGARRPGGARAAVDPDHASRRRTTSRSRPGSARRAPRNIIVHAGAVRGPGDGGDRARVVPAVHRGAARRSSTSSARRSASSSTRSRRRCARRSCCASRRA